jgi:hypothetical protein
MAVINAQIWRTALNLAFVPGESRQALHCFKSVSLLLLPGQNAITALMHVPY